MSARIPASERIRERLYGLIEGCLPSRSGRGELFRLAARQVIEEGPESQARDAFGREHCGHGGETGGVDGNGVRGGQPRTAEGFIDCAAQQNAGGGTLFRSLLRGHLKGNSEALDELAIEMPEHSAPDIDDAFGDASGRPLLSGTEEPELGGRLRTRFQEFSAGDSNECGIARLFVRIAGRSLQGQRRGPALSVWGFALAAKKAPLSLMAGSKEDAETVSACFTRSARQRCRANRLRNVTAKALGDVWPEFKARDPAAGVARDCRTGLASAVALFQDDLEAIIAHLRLTAIHRRAAPTTNLPERLFSEPAAEEHSRRVRRECGAQTEVRRHDLSRRTLAHRQGHRFCAPSHGCTQGRARPGMPARMRPQTETLDRKTQARLPSTARI